MDAARPAKPESGAVRSVDGTTIGYVKIGAGPAVVIVHGALCSHEDWMDVAQELSSHFTCYVVDRRGRGVSGDSESYAVDREIEDIEAVLAAAGPGAFLVGHSYGALLSLLTALRTPVARVVVYEPPWPVHGAAHGQSVVLCPPLIKRGRCEDALVIFFREIGLFPRGLLGSLFRALPMRLKAKVIPGWPKMINLMPVTVREMAAVDGMSPSLVRFAALSMPTLFLLGSQSSQHHIRDTTLELTQLVPNARLCELAGQGHMAQAMAPKLVATEIAEFLKS